jgi:hypothetical protein
MSDNTQVKGLVLGNKTYDRMKFTVQIVLPALVVLYTTLSSIWGWGAVQEVAGTITAVALFLGLCLRISSSNFDTNVKGSSTSTPVGTFVVHEDESGKKTVKLELDQNPEDFIGNSDITFKTSKKSDLETDES